MKTFDSELNPNESLHLLRVELNSYIHVTIIDKKKKNNNCNNNL